MANDVQQGKALGEFAAKQGAKYRRHHRRPHRLRPGLADEFEKAVEANGLKVVATEYTNDKATDFKAILTKIKSKKPDLVFYGGMDAQGGPMVKQMKALGIKAKFLTGDGICTPEFIKLGGDAAAEGQHCSLPGMPLDKLAKGPEFKDKFSKKYNARNPALRTVRLRRSDGDGRFHEAGQFGQSGQVICRKSARPAMTV
jgi:branched-chain amino acid transport system substrate-binding protein